MTIEERTKKYALLTIQLYKYLNNDEKEYILSKQLLRSGTSIGANVIEAQAAQSKKDFIAKMSIASKEARETKYWIELLDESKYLKNFKYMESLTTELDSIINIISKIIITAKQNLEKELEK